MKTLVVMRGLPGSGKSFSAAQLTATAKALAKPKAFIIRERYVDVVVASADHFFEKTGQYNFDASKLGEAHKQCFQSVIDAMFNDTDLIIVDNTNTQLWEFENYLKLAVISDYSIIIDEHPAKDKADVETFWARCTHGVPLDKMMSMFKRFEKFDLEQWFADNKIMRGYSNGELSYSKAIRLI